VVVAVKPGAFWSVFLLGIATTPYSKLRENQKCFLISLFVNMNSLLL